MKDEIIIVENKNDIDNIIELERNNNLIEEYEREIERINRNLNQVKISKKIFSMKKLFFGTIITMILMNGGLSLGYKIFETELISWGSLGNILTLSTSIMVLFASAISILFYMERKSNKTIERNYKNKLLKLEKELDNCKSKKKELTLSNNKDYSKSYTTYKWNPNTRDFYIENKVSEENVKSLKKVKK